MERDQATKFIYDLLRLMVSKKASDLFITVGFPPAIKLDGKMTPVSQQPLSAQHTAELVRSVMNDRQAAEFEASKECNFALSPAGIGRFRVNAFVQQGSIGMVLRTINAKIPTIEELGLPPVLKDVSMTKRGLVIMVGDEPYYAKAGFRNLPEGLLIMPGPVNPDRFLYRELVPGALAGVHGVVLPPFRHAEHVAMLRAAADSKAEHVSI